MTRVVLQRGSPSLKCRPMILDGIAVISSLLRDAVIDKGVAYLEAKLHLSTIVLTDFSFSLTYVAGSLFAIRLL